MVTRKIFPAMVSQMVELDRNERSETRRKDFVLLQHNFILLEQQKTMQKGLSRFPVYIYTKRRFGQFFLKNELTNFDVSPVN